MFFVTTIFQTQGMARNYTNYSDTSHANKNIIFLNLSKLVLPDFSLSLNHRISKRAHLDFTLAYKLLIKGYGTFLVSPTSECGLVDQDRFHWITAEIGSQYYYNRNLYIGNSLLYRYKFYTKQVIYHGCDESTSLRSEYVNILENKLLFGYQTKTNPSIDLYLGVGYRLYFIHSVVYSYNHNGSPYPLYPIPHTSNDIASRLTIHFGMRIGINLKR